MTYTEGWPKKVHLERLNDPPDTVEVVPLSDMERLREERDAAVDEVERLRLIYEAPEAALTDEGERE